jgi:hypothetical protein
MTPEQFDALMCAVRGIAMHLHTESALQGVNTEDAIMLRCEADKAQKEMIAEARKLFVVEPPKEKALT